MWLLWFRSYGYLSKTAKFSFLTMDYSPWSWRNLINRNRLKKFMQVKVDVKCMHTDFGGRGLWWVGLELTPRFCLQAKVQFRTDKRQNS